MSNNTATSIIVFDVNETLLDITTLNRCLIASLAIGLFLESGLRN